ncbi:precorrin-6A/cobalt-precorrin-6A reductase [Sulfitobacter undariae]|uniref:Precorrin-6A/cobalt-precorrin-6A reductase n=1 Tax=Sulfitobacter undariae TaxID=1563671 RepID=A0A7W6E1R0_9RHOB|nr:cobalt-precorrin-6A reductase [Sulfitobacter undariae]MBB3993100.1 precorrin-6A/cobalt-precorrin-6A reductase [Sulfitobacter undariae]
MRPNPLILGGTTEATALCKAFSEAGQAGTVSLAGRVARPIRHPLPQRVGGFGDADGLTRYITDHKITHLIDATHPFAAQMSLNAVLASQAAKIPLIALTRAPWHAEAGDNWADVADIPAAVAALNMPQARIMLAVGRMHLQDFAPNPQHFYLLRLVDAPDAPLPFADHAVVVDRGPFTVQGDLALMHQHQITHVVSKNSGGTGAQAKLLAARSLNLPVIMINRPVLPPRPEVYNVAAVMAWLGHDNTDRGV